MHYYYKASNFSEHSAPLQSGLLTAIKNEAKQIQFYRELSKIAPNQKHKHKLYNIIEDETKHLQQLISLYSSLTGAKPIYETNQIMINSYMQGIEEAIDDELRDYDLYRSLTFQTNHPVFQNVFLQAYMDEMKHAVLLTNLRNFESKMNQQNPVMLKDYGSEPFVININDTTLQNTNYRTSLWTGKHLQLTLMSIDVEGEIGLELHPTTDQFLRIEQGDGIVMMGDEKEQLTFKKNISDDDMIIIPAGKWHNIMNTGNKPLKIYSIYAPPHHPFGTIHITKEREE